MGALPFTDAFPQGLQRHLETDFVPVFKTVGNGFRRTVYLDRNTLDLLRFDPFVKGSARELKEPERQVPNARLPLAPFDGHPDLVGQLGRNIVKAQGGKQAYDTMGNPFGGLDQGEVFGGVTFRQPVKASADPLKAPFTHQSRQVDGGNSFLRKFTGTDDTVPPDMINQFLDRSTGRQCLQISSLVYF